MANKQASCVCWPVWFNYRSRWPQIPFKRCSAPSTKASPTSNLHSERENVLLLKYLCYRRINFFLRSALRSKSERNKEELRRACHSERLTQVEASVTSHATKHPNHPSGKTSNGWMEARESLVIQWNFSFSLGRTFQLRSRAQNCVGWVDGVTTNNTSLCVPHYKAYFGVFPFALSLWMT